MNPVLVILLELSVRHCQKPICNRHTIVGFMIVLNEVSGGRVQQYEEIEYSKTRGRVSVSWLFVVET